MRRGTIRALAALAALSLFAAGCRDRTGTELRAQGVALAEVPPGATRDAMTDTGAFAADVYRQLAGRPGNFAFSPLAVATGLAMSRAGAGGATASQLTDLLHAGQTPSFDAGLGVIWRSLDDRTGERRSDVRKGRVDLDIPSAAWLQKGTTVKGDYLDTLARNYGVGVQTVDFRSDPEAARRAINNWAGDETAGAIAQLAPRGTITQLTRLALASGISLRAPWEVVFPADQTALRPFHLAGGETTEVPMMVLRDQDALSYAHGDGWDAVSLPYLGRELEMVVILPAEGTFGDFERHLDGRLLDEIVSRLHPTAVEIHLPRFQFTTQADMSGPLGAAGAPDVFSRQDADLSGITDQEPLAVSTALHQAFLSADEQGTDGAAVTVITGQAPPRFSATTITLDRPFLVLVRDVTTDAPLFLGRVVSPAE